MNALTYLIAWGVVFPGLLTILLFITRALYRKWEKRELERFREKVRRL